MGKLGIFVLILTGISLPLQMVTIVLHTVTMADCLNKNTPLPDVVCTDTSLIPGTVAIEATYGAATLLLSVSWVANIVLICGLRRRYSSKKVWKRLFVWKYVTMMFFAVFYHFLEGLSTQGNPYTASFLGLTKITVAFLMLIENDRECFGKPWQARVDRTVSGTLGIDNLLHFLMAVPFLKSVVSGEIGLNANVVEGTPGLWNAFLLLLTVNSVAFRFVLARFFLQRCWLGNRSFSLLGDAWDLRDYNRKVSIDMADGDAEYQPLSRIEVDAPEQETGTPEAEPKTAEVTAEDGAVLSNLTDEPDHVDEKM
ncbi:uncharacterized protein LOC118405817 [Branchiostoma floridae]|uniref:Uncharacterized protein LOC118405817 n=1 Tax=Branchiostoma floridae TaxID=7739 RepID=A0A9J7KG65_BRAFL|nr:uncharacterized protein LOC118405817 [Branchiostoma floridae]